MFQKAVECLNRNKTENPQFKKFIEVWGIRITRWRWGNGKMWSQRRVKDRRRHFSKNVAQNFVLPTSLYNKSKPQDFQMHSRTITAKLNSWIGQPSSDY